MSVRKKRKPDNVRLNLVSSHSGSLRISRLSVPIRTSSPGSSNLQVSSSSHIAGQLQPSVEDTLSETEDIGLELDNDLYESVDRQSGNTRSHMDREKKLAEGWSSVRDNIFRSINEQAALPLDSLCHLCGAEATVLCSQCGPYTYYCVSCAKQLHMKTNIFHTPLCWQVDEQIFKPMEMAVCLLGPHGTSCYGHYYRELTCIGGFGTHRDVNFCFCACHSEAETLTRLGFFPSTPTYPSTAFQFLLLDELESLLLECQVPLKDFLAALNCYSVLPFMQPQQDNRHLYKRLIDLFEEYRYIKNELRHMQRVCMHRSNGTECPACPKNAKSLRILSIDGNFGLSRKKAAGISVRPPLHERTFFESQEQVDAYIADYKMPKSSTEKECSNFLAGDLLRSKSRYAALDETGVLGVACRHEFPYHFYSLRHGERISYIVYALERIKSCCSGEQQVLLLYDVACMLKKHLQGIKREDLLNFFTCAVPVFHSYGHVVHCQLSMNPRYKEGFGLTDGEVLERLWSFLRRFCKMTKEMRPSHRIDVLTDALLHYCRLSSRNLKYLLPLRKARAIQVRNDAEKELRQLIEKSPVSFSEDDICDWLTIEQRQHQTIHPGTETPSWTTEYFSYLQQYYHLRFVCDVMAYINEFLFSNEIASSTISDVEYFQILSNRIHRLEGKIQTFEIKHNVPQRWTCDSTEYQCIKERLTVKKKNAILANLGLCARDRWFMLSLKGKFADGQYMASRISKLINKQTEKLKTLLSDYNKVVSVDDCITWEDVTNLASPFWLKGENLESIVPRPIRLQAINMLSKFHRALEELHLLDEEMINVLIHHLQDHAVLTNGIKSLECCSSQFNRGCLCLLKLRLSDCIKEIKECVDSFSKSHSSILTCVCNGGYLVEERVDVLLQICKDDSHNSCEDQNFNSANMNGGSPIVFYGNSEEVIDYRVTVDGNKRSINHRLNIDNQESHGNHGVDISNQESNGNYGVDVSNPASNGNHGVDISNQESNGNHGVDISNQESHGNHQVTQGSNEGAIITDQDQLQYSSSYDYGGNLDEYANVDTIPHMHELLRYWQSHHEDSDDYEGDSDQLQDVEQWYQPAADMPNTPTQNLSDAEYDDDQDFISEGTKNALRAKDRLEKAEFLEKHKKSEGVDSLLNLFSEEEKRLAGITYTKKPRFDHSIAIDCVPLNILQQSRR